MKDISEHCEIWYRKYAKAILKILAEVFNDIEEINSLFNSLVLAEEDSEGQSDMDQSDTPVGNNSSLFEFLLPK